ncbi:MAG TPA: DNA internalization-related competence protein ComEC/Rec2, partial [Arenimonas sp.]|nr:DNA internalization-related competence protein ComEC/Rec2 [Arenimonas sp.]
PGFWLSFLGVAWLMWCLPDAHEAGLLRSFLHAQGVAMLGLLPLTVWFFSQASLAGVLVNLVGIPWISLGVVPLAVLGLLAAPLSTAAADTLWRLAAWLMDVLWSGLERIAESPLSLLWLPEPSLPILLLALLGAFWLLLPRGVPGKPLAAVLLLPLLWPAQDRPAHGEADLVMLDVGQGSSVLIRTRGHALLFDAGPAAPHGLDMGEAAVLPALRSLGVLRLDALLVSHGHNDHSGGVGAIRRELPVASTRAPEGWPLADASLCQREQSWEWDGVRFRILHPPPLYPYMGNDSSCVLRVEAAGASALLPGDIGRHVEARLLKEQPAALPAEVLVVPHHGSPTSSSAPFVAAVAPQLALFGVGSNNRFDLPRDEIVARYREVGSTLLDSAGSGMVRVRLGAGGAELRERYRFDHPRYWRPAEALAVGDAAGSGG